MDVAGEGVKVVVGEGFEPQLENLNEPIRVCQFT
jgi:hypothetical protein